MLYFALLYSCNKYEPKIISFGNNYDELITNILELTSCKKVDDLEKYVITHSDDDSLSSDSKSQNDLDPPDEIPYEISDIVDEKTFNLNHCISYKLSDQSKKSVYNNLNSDYCNAYSCCNVIISILSTENKTVNMSFMKLFNSS